MSLFSKLLGYILIGGILGWLAAQTITFCVKHDGELAKRINKGISTIKERKQND